MITVYSKVNCQQCKSAKILLDMKGREYVVKMLDTDFTEDELKELSPTSRSYPVIFNNSKLLGGFHQLQQLLNGDNL